MAKAWAEHREEKSLDWSAGSEYKFVVSATWLEGETARSANDPRKRFKLVLSDGLPSRPGIYFFYTADAFVSVKQQTSKIEWTNLPMQEWWKDL